MILFLHPQVDCGQRKAPMVVLWSWARCRQKSCQAVGIPHHWRYSEQGYHRGYWSIQEWLDKMRLKTVGTHIRFTPVYNKMRKTVMAGDMEALGEPWRKVGMLRCQYKVANFSVLWWSLLSSENFFFILKCGFCYKILLVNDTHFLCKIIIGNPICFFLSF